MLVLRHARAVVSAAVLVAVAAACPAPARADVKSECVEAHAAAQKARTAKKLLEARGQLVVCARSECPQIARADCSQWLTELNAELPSVVVVATDAAGNDLTDVRVIIDGAPAVEELDGRDIVLDPGPHTLRFERTGSVPVQQKIVLRIGELRRRVPVVLKPEPAAAPAAPPGPAPDAGGGRRVPAASIILGGVGLVGLGGFAYFGLDGLSKRSDLDQCKPDCPSDDVDATRRSFLIADISLAVGVLALGGAAYFYFSQPKRTAPRSGALWLGASALPGGAAAGVGGRF